MSGKKFCYNNIKMEAFLGRIFVVLISLASGFALMEKMVRIYTKEETSSNYYELNDNDHYPRPYVMAAAKPDGYMINSLGYRGPSPERFKKPDEYRIFILGGSTVFYGHPPFSSILQSEFAKNGAFAVKVFNMGNVSSNSTQDLIRILLDVSELQPDLIIMYGGGNDLMEYGESRPGYPHRYYIYETNPLWTKDISDYKWGPLMLYGSAIFRKLFPQYFERSFLNASEQITFLPAAFSPGMDLPVEIYYRSLQKAAKLAKVFNSEFMAIFQPNLYYKHPLSEAERSMSKSHQLSLAQARRQKVWDYHRNNGQNFHFHDLSEVFSGNKDKVFIDNIHVTDEANFVLAKEIFHQINHKFPEIISKTKTPRDMPKNAQTKTAKNVLLTTSSNYSVHDAD